MAVAKIKNVVIYRCPKLKEADQKIPPKVFLLTLVPCPAFLSAVQSSVYTGNNSCISSKNLTCVIITEVR